MELKVAVAQSPNWMKKMAGSSLKTEGYHLKKSKKLTALLLLYNAHSILTVWKYDM